MGTRLCLAITAALALLTSCGDAVDEVAAGTTTDTRSADGAPGCDPCAGASRPRMPTGQRSGPYDLELEGVRVVQHEGGDRIVLTLGGDGSPGWVVRYVNRAVTEGSGQVIHLDGDTVLRVDIYGTPTQASGTTPPVRRSLAGDVVDLHAVSAWEGATSVFLGLEGGRTPFRVSSLSTPSRLVVDLQ